MASDIFLNSSSGDGLLPDLTNVDWPSASSSNIHLRVIYFLMFKSLNAVFEIYALDIKITYLGGQCVEHGRPFKTYIIESDTQTIFYLDFKVIICSIRCLVCAEASFSYGYRNGILGWILLRQSMTNFAKYMYMVIMIYDNNNTWIVWWYDAFRILFNDDGQSL